MSHTLPPSHTHTNKHVRLGAYVSIIKVLWFTATLHAVIQCNVSYGYVVCIQEAVEALELSDKTVSFT